MLIALAQYFQALLMVSLERRQFYLLAFHQNLGYLNKLNLMSPKMSQKMSPQMGSQMGSQKSVLQSNSVKLLRKPVNLLLMVATNFLTRDLLARDLLANEFLARDLIFLQIFVHQTNLLD